MADLNQNYPRNIQYEENGYNVHNCRSVTISLYLKQIIKTDIIQLLKIHHKVTFKFLRELF